MTRQTVDLTAYPDLMVLYLGMADPCGRGKGAAVPRWCTGLRRRADASVSSAGRAVGFL